MLNFALLTVSVVFLFTPVETLIPFWSPIDTVHRSYHVRLLGILNQFGNSTGEPEEELASPQDNTSENSRMIDMSFICFPSGTCPLSLHWRISAAKRHWNSFLQCYVDISSLSAYSPTAINTAFNPAIAEQNALLVATCAFSGCTVHYGEASGNWVVAGVTWCLGILRSSAFFFGCKTAPFLRRGQSLDMDGDKCCGEVGGASREAEGVDAEGFDVPINVTINVRHLSSESTPQGGILYLIRNSTTYDIEKNLTPFAQLPTSTNHAFRYLWKFPKGYFVSSSGRRCLDLSRSQKTKMSISRSILVIWNPSRWSWLSSSPLDVSAVITNSGLPCPLIFSPHVSNDLESLYHLCLMSTYPAAVAVSGVPGDGSRVHTHDHGGSEAPDESLDSILSSEPKPLRKHMPPPPPSILSPKESSYPS
ncbi:hypothetical protein Tco_0167220 [Tanacetum coccineum]